MIPVTMLYGTPEDSAAQIAYIKKRGYPIGYIEMGEEPDGKHAMPEDYGALYIQWADALAQGGSDAQAGWSDLRRSQRRHPRVARRAGPHFVDGTICCLSEVTWASRRPGVCFLRALSLRAACKITWKDLYAEPKLMKGILKVWRDDGVPANVPLMVTESHLAASLTGPMSTIFAGLWLADNIGSFFRGWRRGVLPFPDSAAVGAGYLPRSGHVVQFRHRQATTTSAGTLRSTSRRG